MRQRDRSDVAVNTARDVRERRLPLRGFAHVDALRAVAVMMVVVSHAGLEMVPGGSGVTVFFVISGFIITHLLVREHEKTGAFDLRGFYVRRALKIFPPLLLVVTLPSLVYGLVRDVDWVEVAGQVFFYFNWTYVDSHVQVLPGSVVVWSLSIEEQFYVAVALVWLLLVRRRDPVPGLRVLAWCIVVGSLTARVVLHLAGASSDRIYFGTDTRAEGIAIGILVALWFRTRRRQLTAQRAEVPRADAEAQPSGLAREGVGRIRAHGEVLGSDIALVAAVLAFLVSLVIRDETFRDTVRYTIQAGAGAVVVMWGLVGARGPIGRVVVAVMKWPVVQLLGLSSYSIYLAHLIVMRTLEPWTRQLPGPVGFLMAAVLGTAAGILVWWAVEEPVVRWRRARTLRRKGS